MNKGSQVQTLINDLLFSFLKVSCDNGRAYKGGVDVQDFVGRLAMYICEGLMARFQDLGFPLFQKLNCMIV